MINGSLDSQRLCLRYVIRHPVAFREYWVPMVSKRRYWGRYTFAIVMLAAKEGDTLLRAGRASGKCLSGESVIMDPETGALSRIEDVVSGAQKYAWTLDHDVVRPAVITGKSRSGQQACLRLTLGSGHAITLTPSHHLLTAEGWVPAGRLVIGDTIATPAALGWPASPVRLPAPDVDLLAILLAEGGITSTTVVYTTMDQEIVRIARSAADELGAESRLLPSGRGMTHLLKRVTDYGANPVRAMLDLYGIAHEKSIEKTIPAALFSAPADQVARFLSIFWMCDGYVTGNEIGITLGSERMLRQMQHLLLRFGIRSKASHRLAKVGKKTFDAWRVAVYADSRQAFAQAIVLWGEKARRVQALMSKQTKRPVNPNVGYPTVSLMFVRTLAAHGSGVSRLVTNRARRPLPSRVRLSLPRFRTWAQQHNIASTYPHLMAEGVWWDEVVAIQDAGIRETYDLEMFPTVNFVADDVIVHNSYAFLEPELVQHAITHPGEETLLTSFRKIHIMDRMERVLDYFELPFFKLFVKRILRSPYFIELHIGHIIHGLSVGDDPEARMAQGKHASFLAIEEAQQYPSRAWLKVQGAKDPRGSRTLMVGVPDGRLDTPYRRADSIIQSFGPRRFEISRRHDPYFDQRTKRDMADTLGGEDSDTFGQEIDAKWGHPAWSAWDMDAIYKCREASLSPEFFEVSGKLYVEAGITPSAACGDLPPCPYEGRIRLAMDVGYSQPSEIGAFVFWDGRWQLFTRIRLVNRMEHTDQAAILDEIGKKYGVEHIGIDTTEGEGRAIAHEMESRYTWSSRIVRVTFTETLLVGWILPDRNEESEDENEEPEEVWEHARSVGTRVLRTLFTKRGVAISHDESIPTEFNQEREVRDQEGKTRVITPSTVHITDMMRVFAVMEFLETPLSPPETGASGEFVDIEHGDRPSPWAPTTYPL